MEEMQSKTDKIKPKSFPYTFYLMDEKQEKAYDESLLHFSQSGCARNRKSH